MDESHEPETNPLYISSDDDEQNLNFEFEREIKKNIIMDSINILYKNTIESFKNGNKLVYNPNIFFNITSERFIDWIINNNNELTELFN